MSVGKWDYFLRLQILLFFTFEWHNKIEVGNIGILALWRDREKLHRL